MRIGILTLPFNNNYGGYLQAYALLTVLKQMGHDVELIYRRHNKRPLKYRLLYVFKTVVKCILRIPYGPLIPSLEYDHRHAGKMMLPFVDKNISPKTKPYFTTASMEKSCKGKYDVVIVGSDQIWRPIYVPNINDFFLEFIKDQIEHKYNGYLVEPKDVDGLCKGICWVLNIDNYSVLSENCRKWICSKYSYDKVMSYHSFLLNNKKNE